MMADSMGRENTTQHHDATMHEHWTGGDERGLSESQGSNNSRNTTPGEEDRFNFS